MYYPRYITELLSRMGYKVYYPKLSYLFQVLPVTYTVIYLTKYNPILYVVLLSAKTI